MATFRALICERLSDDLSGLVLRDLPTPALGVGDVRIAIRSASLNFPDLLMTRGGYQFKPRLPFVPEMEGSGAIVELGAEVRGWRPGDAISFWGYQGALAEEAVLPAASLRPVPTGLSFEEAAGYYVTGITAWVSIVQLGHLQPQETLLVHGARGGVGNACVRLGLHLGARVIATAAQPDGLASLAQQGAIVISSAPGFGEAILERTGGKGVEVIADPVEGDVFDESLRCIAWGGGLLVLGFASGRIPTLATNLALIKGISLIGVRAGEFGRRFPETLAPAVGAVQRLASVKAYCDRSSAPATRWKMRCRPLPPSSSGALSARSSSRSIGEPGDTRVVYATGQLRVKPPSTIRVCPMTYAASGDARNSAGPAMSSGRPNLPAGMRSRNAARRFGCPVVTRVILVSTMPGAMPFTRIPSGAQASPSVRVSPRAPVLEAL